MIIREATLKDLHKLRELAVRVFTVTFKESNNPDDFKTFMDAAYSVNQLEKEFAERGAIYFVAVDGENFTGYARVRENDEVDNLLGTNHLELQRLYVDVPYQGKGVANALMDVCEQVAAHRGKQWIWLGVWEHNTKAQHFYGKHGYERFSQHDFMVGTDRQTDWLMRKPIISR